MTLQMLEIEKYNEGRLDMLIRLLQKGLLKLSDAVVESGLSEKEFLEEMGKSSCNYKKA